MSVQLPLLGQPCDADGDGYNWSLAFSDDSQTDVCFMSESWSSTTYSSLDPDNWLITPEVALGGKLKFKTWNYSSYYPDMIAVYVCNNPDWESLDEFVLLQDNIVPGLTAEEYEIDLSDYEGMGCIAFRHYNSYDQMRIFVDDIEVTVPGAQEVPEWIVVEGVTSPYTIEGLTAATEYEVQVQAVGQTGTSDWTESLIFTTLDAPHVAVDEVAAGKTVARVRYFNVAGQEMAQPSGLTIQVTTYSDGTTSAVKVVK